MAGSSGGAGGPDDVHEQLVGATVNKQNAFPKPGTAVYTVLSGQFDQLPATP